MLPESAENCCQATPISWETIHRCRRDKCDDRRRGSLEGRSSAHRPNARAQADNCRQGGRGFQYLDLQAARLESSRRKLLRQANFVIVRLSGSSPPWLRPERLPGNFRFAASAKHSHAGHASHYALPRLSDRPVVKQQFCRFTRARHQPPSRRKSHGYRVFKRSCFAVVHLQVSNEAP